MNRREFIYSSLGAAAFVSLPSFAVLADGTRCLHSASAPTRRSDEKQNRLIAKWDEAAEAVSPQVYGQYMLDGDVRGFKVLEAAELAFKKVMREVCETVVTGDVPAIWSVYNMGYIVKTRESLFSIDLVHRRDMEFAPLLDFALVTHNHGDHWRDGFCRAMDTSHKTIISNFLENHGATEWEKIDGVHPNDWGMMSFARAYGNAVKTALGLTKQAKLER